MSLTTMRPANISLPYLDILLEQLTLGEVTVQKAFGRHVHWGYWPNPTQADRSIENFAIASEQLCQRVYAAAGVQEGDQVLDAGYGFGGTIASLNEQFQNLHLTGLNIDFRQLDRAREEVKPLGNNQIIFVEGDACQMPFPDASMDVVLAVECIFHFPSRTKFFQEARRVLRPGGRLGICDTKLNSIKGR
ncbi:MAG TPA: class I SAM-dependent methyltransferase [Stenomitos sp.]